MVGSGPTDPGSNPGGAIPFFMEEKIRTVGLFWISEFMRKYEIG